MEHSVPTRGSDAFMHFGVRDASVARSGNMERKDKKAPSVRIEPLNRKKDLLFLFPISDMIIFVRNTVSTCYQLSTVHDRTQGDAIWSAEIKFMYSQNYLVNSYFNPLDKFGSKFTTTQQLTLTLPPNVHISTQSTAVFRSYHHDQSTFTSAAYVVLLTKF